MNRFGSTLFNAIIQSKKMNLIEIANILIKLGVDVNLQDT